MGKVDEFGGNRRLIDKVILEEQAPQSLKD